MAFLVLILKSTSLYVIIISSFYGISEHIQEIETQYPALRNAPEVLHDKHTYEFKQWFSKKVS